MRDERELWREVHAAFEFHRKDTDPDAQAAMNRVAAKCIGSKVLEPLGPAQCSLCEETLSLADLGGLKVFHERDKPYHLNDPIVVLVHYGQRVVIEGNTRVNAWRKGARKEPFRAILVARRAHAA